LSVQWLEAHHHERTGRRAVRILLVHARHPRCIRHHVGSPGFSRIGHAFQRYESILHGAAVHRGDRSAHRCRSARREPGTTWPLHAVHRQRSGLPFRAEDGQDRFLPPFSPTPDAPPPAPPPPPPAAAPPQPPAPPDVYAHPPPPARGPDDQHDRPYPPGHDRR